MNQELLKILKWRNEVMISGEIDKYIDESVLEAETIIMNPVTILSMLENSDIEGAMQAAFAMGMLWQRFLGQEENNGLANLLKDVKLD